MEPAGTSIMTVGKYTGNSFSEILTKDRAYCRWAILPCGEGPANWKLQQLSE